VKPFFQLSLEKFFAKATVWRRQGQTRGQGLVWIAKVKAAEAS
jgi:hypothetical protein